LELTHTPTLQTEYHIMGADTMHCSFNKTTLLIL